MEKFLNQNIEEDCMSEKVNREGLKMLLKDKIDSSDLYEVERSLDFAKSIHKDQVQIDGEPYLDHVLEVVDVVVDKFKIYDKNVIISAVLHDSLEDQHKKLFYNYVISLFDDMSDINVDKLDEMIDNLSANFNQELLEIASWNIEKEFGSDIAHNIELLSKPNFESFTSFIESNSDASISKSKLKNELYFTYFQKILNSENYDVIIIKCADFLNNISKNQFLKDEARQEKLKKKYGPVLINLLIPYFKGIKENHPLYKVRGDVLACFESYVDYFTGSSNN